MNGRTADRRCRTVRRARTTSGKPSSRHKCGASANRVKAPSCRGKLLADHANGRPRTTTRRDLRVIAEEIQRRTNGDAAVSLHLSYVADWKALAGALTGNPLGLLAGIDPRVTVDDRALRYRLASVLPGRGFRRLATRLILAQHEYFALDRSLRNLWYTQFKSAGS